MKPSPLFSLAGLGMILIGMLSILWSLNYGSKLIFILIGFLAWGISVGLKFAWAIPTNKKIINYVGKKFPVKFSGPLTWTYLGLLTGIFECGIALLFVLFIPSLLNANWQNIIGFGIGFGAIESIVLGLMFFTNSLYFLAKPSIAPKEMKKLWKKYKKYSFTVILVPIVERVTTIPVHLFTIILIVLAVQQNMPYFFWVSFFFKSSIDSVAAWSNLKKGVANWKEPKQIWLVEFIFIIFAIISLFGIFWLFRI